MKNSRLIETLSIFSKPIVVLTVFLILVASIASSEPYTAKVIGIKDGDTISILHEGREETIRLNGIDCPEKNKRLEAKQRNLLLNLFLVKLLMLNL